MRFSTFAPLRQLRSIATSVAALSLLTMACVAQPDPPDEAGRVSAVSGTVSIQPSGSDDWGQVYANVPIGPGDRIFTDQDGRVEIQVGQSYLRIGPNSDVTLVNYAPDSISFGVGQGSVHVRSFGFWQGQGLDISTPNGDGRLDQAGEMRVDTMPDDGATVFTSFNSNVLVTGAGGFGQEIGNFQSLELAGTNPVYPEWLQPNQPDDLDAWSQGRDRLILNASSYRYVSPEIGGAAELDANGDWVPDSDYGPIWFPRGVEAGWQPYHNGHWINRDPWGWVWVEDEPWGYAPFHYGRWVYYHDRWGWVPGPREQHPVWSPALVVFAGGINVGGAGVAAWFPLGPGEPYRPWYHCSPTYVDRVNITNIHESRVVHVQRTYVNIVNVTNVTNITYVNRTVGVTAVRQADFAAGRPVQRSVVNVDRHQFDHVQVVDRPAPVMKQSIIPRPVAAPVRVAAARPAFINRQGMQISATPGARPVAPPVRQAPPPAATRPLPGRTAVAPPAGSKFQNHLPANAQQQPAMQQPGRPPVAPNVRPNGAPIPSTAGQEQRYTNQQPAGNRPNQPDVGHPPQVNPPTPGRQMNPPNQPPAERPGMTPPNQPPAGRTAPPPNQPAERMPPPPQRNPPPPAANSRQDFGQAQPNKRDQTVAPPPRQQPPANNAQPVRPNPVPPRAQPNQPDNRPQARPQQPPQSNRGNEQKNDKDQKKKDEKKPE
ncbi:MAG TPA: DUF6600 domain-containing protein [Terracidiphilus sp.]|nr:DUF6600 domain-containing protein [Terracidiphilus sp.]